VKRILVLAVAALVARGAVAQPGGNTGGMPDLRTLSGRPLPAPELPAGTVLVRVSNRLPMNGVGDVEVVALTKKASGETRRRALKTGPDGRAQFEALPAGAQFQAEATVAGEHLTSTAFPIPDKAGVRVLLIAGLAAAPPEAEGQPFTLGAVTGKLTAADDVPAGSIEIRLVGDDGKPLAHRAVQLGQARKDAESQLKVLRAESDDAGVARFRDLVTGDAVGYAAVMEHQGLRLGTEAFRLPADKGMRGEIRGIARTTDPSVLRFDNRSKMIITLGEDALEVMEAFVFKNVSEKIFDPGPDGLRVPLAEGAESAKEIEGGIPIEVHSAEGAVAVKAPIPPNRAAVFAQQIRMGFFLLAKGSSRVELRQPLPFGLESPFFIVPAAANLTLSAPGLRAAGERTDGQGNPVKVYEMSDLTPGSVLALTVSGLPALDHTARNLAAGLCLLMIAGAVVLGRNPGGPGRPAADVDKLSERREKLFTELVTLERTRREGGTSAPLTERRQELVTKLEGVYRELARREQSSPATGAP
jgi:hypothetical protein